MTYLDIERTELREFTATVQASAVRSLGFLHALESTLTWLERLTRQLQADVIFAEESNRRLDKITGTLDPDGAIQSALEAAQEAIEALYRLLIERRQHGREDRQLTEEDGIEATYTEAIAQAADLHNAINTLRWNIGEHDIDAEPYVSDPAKVFSSPEEIEAYLLSL